MENSRLFIDINEHNEKNKTILSEITEYVEEHTDSIVYIITAPLNRKYTYTYESNALVILSPKKKIIFVNLGDNEEEFEDYVEDFIEDIGNLSDNFEYKAQIGRPREWSKKVISKIDSSKIKSIETLFNQNTLIEGREQRIAELIITLLIGSINDIKAIGVEQPETALEKIRKNILLFDADQTRFIYKDLEQKMILIQGLSGTGKTELLLHKLKEIYVASDDSKIFFTCHNKALANSLRNRIPQFFNFMQVRKQIEWEKRLWVNRAWGTRNDADSGLYTYLCHFYNAPFQPYNKLTSYDSIFSKLIEHIEDIPEADFIPALDYIIIDERQDFPDSFFELCGKVTKNKVYAAGDIFQDIFETSKESKIPVDISLNRCYRTDPRTLMFAHAVGMGLFEIKKLNWLTDKQWKEIGYDIERTGDESCLIRLRREPIRRFGETEVAKESSIVIKDSTDCKDVIAILAQIRNDYPDVRPHEIAIILFGDTQNMYGYIDGLCPLITEKIGWQVVRGYEQKEIVEDKLYITNPNNVKGLEFPFVLCISPQIQYDYRYRNILYTMVTRSFLKTFILLTNTDNIEPQLKGLDIINQYGYIETKEPSKEEITEIKSTIIEFRKEKPISYEKFITAIFQELDIYDLERRKKIEKSLENVNFDKFDKENTIKFIQSILKYI
ncbi:DEAD/DEAH box helicase [Prevotella intermedia]|uniref:ATP-dependent helicase n=1 Tax=Prevotella intermedia TaxID=28131 RepID=A0A2D3LHP6_PREIN|nr:ATP-binding domain-containing protein [Prevotella intermedia]ATV30117.1 ATP-dependent helicase [Prevotella intermedia]PJI22080.1 ATP-dependent helicase [Prevotella intermedia]